MNFKKFSTKIKETLCGAQIHEESAFHGHSIIESVDGDIYIDYRRTHLTSIDEAKLHLENSILEEEIVQEIYEDIPNSTVATIIREHHDIKVTDTLIEKYLELASSKTFSIDPVVSDIRSLNSVDSILINKIDFVLNDKSTVAISENTYQKLSRFINDKYQLVDYMRESKDNFIRVIKELS